MQIPETRAALPTVTLPPPPSPRFHAASELVQVSWLSLHVVYTPVIKSLLQDMCCNIHLAAPLLVMTLLVARRA